MALTLQLGPFANNVYLHPPASTHEPKLRAADYVRMEEMQTLHTKFCNDFAATTANPTPRPDTCPREPRQPRFTIYAPVTVARSRILDEALQADLIPPPRKTTTPPNTDMTKYCRYHRNHGHTTEECKALQDKIEELVRAGHFRRFTRRDDHSSSSRSRHPPRFDHRRPPHDSRHDRHPAQPTRQEPEPARTDIAPVDPPPLRGTINTISGGFASGGSTSSARKRHLRHIQSINHITHSHHKRRMPPIFFTDDDFHGLNHQQDDPMVITVEIENYAVKKVLVDQGSSVDILY